MGLRKNGLPNRIQTHRPPEHQFSTVHYPVELIVNCKGLLVEVQLPDGHCRGTVRVEFWQVTWRWNCDIILNEMATGLNTNRDMAYFSKHEICIFEIQTREIHTPPPPHPLPPPIKRPYCLAVSCNTLVRRTTTASFTWFHHWDSKWVLWTLGKWINFPNLTNRGFLDF